MRFFDWHARRCFNPLLCTLAVTMFADALPMSSSPGVAANGLAPLLDFGLEGTNASLAQPSAGGEAFSIAQMVRLINENVVIMNSESPPVLRSSQCKTEGPASVVEASCMRYANDIETDATALESRHVNWPRVLEKIAECAGCGGCLWKKEGSDEDCHQLCHLCIH